MVFAILSALSFCLSLKIFSRSGALAWSRLRSGKRTLAELAQVEGALQNIQSLLESGLVPDAGRWDGLQRLPAPWGGLIFGSFRELRSKGGSILPTAKRMRDLVELHRKSMKDAHAKSSQAMAQALVCTALVPLFGGVLYALLPGLESQRTLWIMACLLALTLAGVGGLWLKSMSERARWGGLKSERQNWPIAIQCSGERFLALLRSGMPPDLAWTRAFELLLSQAPELARFWGSSVWESAGLESQAAPSALPVGSARLIALASVSLRKSVQVSMLEGSPCADRVERAMEALRSEIKVQIDQELALLPTRALQPLFLTVAPALFSLLVIGLFLSWEQIL